MWFQKTLGAFKNSGFLLPVCFFLLPLLSFPTLTQDKSREGITVRIDEYNDFYHNNIQVSVGHWRFYCNCWHIQKQLPSSDITF